MKNHSKFYNFLRFMAVVNIAVGGFLLIWLIMSGAFVPRESDSLPSSFYASPVQRRMVDFMILVSGLSGIAFGVCDFVCRLKAVGFLAIVKSVCIVGFIFAFWGRYIIYSLNSPLLWVIAAVAIGYFVCGIYALKCDKDEINNLKLKTE